MAIFKNVMLLLNEAKYGCQMLIKSFTTRIKKQIKDESI